MQGNVGGEDIAESTYTYFPSIAVTSEGYIGLGFGASGPSVYPGAYFAMRLPGDPIGYFGPADTVALGVAAYTPGSDSRWGDYSGMSIDPSDSTRLWAFNMYALSSSEYGTRWKSFSPSIINVPFDKPAIQTAINASSPGTVIQVSPNQFGAPYNENLRLKSGVKVIGISTPTRGLPVLAAPDTAAAVSFPDSAGGNTIFANFILRGGGDEVVHLRGDGVLQDCLIDTTGATAPVGVLAESTGTEARVQNCRIRIGTGSAFKASYFAGAALDDTVEVLGSGLGLEAIGGSGIYSRLIADVADSVGFSFDGVGGSVSNSRVTVGTGTGLLVSGGDSSLTIQDCRIQDSTGVAFRAVGFAGTATGDTLVTVSSGDGLDVVGGSGSYTDMSVNSPHGYGIDVDGASGSVSDCNVTVATGVVARVRASSGATFEFTGCRFTATDSAAGNYGVQLQSGLGKVSKSFISAPGGRGAVVHAGSILQQCTIDGTDIGVIDSAGTVENCISTGFTTYGFEGDSVAYCIAPGPNGFASGTLSSTCANEDPLYCGPGEYSLRIDSYGNPENTDNTSSLGLIGAFPVACMYDTLSRSSTFTNGTLSAPGDVTVLSGDTLTLGSISTAVTIDAPKSDNQSGGSSSDQVELLVEGVLSADRVAFTSAQASPAYDDWYGIDVRDGGVVVIVNSEVMYGTYGLRFRAGANGRVTNTTFAHDGISDCEAWGVSGGDTVLVAGNTFNSGGAYGLYLEYNNSGVHVVGNTFDKVATYAQGVLTSNSGSSAPTIEENTITDFDLQAGIEIQDGAPDIYQNAISGCKYGILVSKGTPVIGDAGGSTRDNSITGNVTDGLRFSGSLAGGTVRHNYLASNGIGIEVTYRSGRPDLGTDTSHEGKNSFYDNTTYCVKNSTGIGILAEGNWWGACPPPGCIYGTLIADSYLCSDPYGPLNVEAPIVRVGETAARALSVRGVWPNPGKEFHAIRLRLEGGRAKVTTEIFDIAGRLVREIGPVEFPEGDHDVQWDGRNAQGQRVTSGMYFVRVRTDKGLRQTAKILVVR